MPQYRYAHDDHGAIVDITVLPRDCTVPQQTYTCIGCGQPLIAKTKGERRIKHFAHKVEVGCNGETYLHKLAKTMFFDTYSGCLKTKTPFTIALSHPCVCTKYEETLGSPCTLPSVMRSHDLTTWYDDIRLEVRDDSFIPDVLLVKKSEPQHKLYIEFAVTHVLSDQKETSVHKIIEIPIGGEDDIAGISRTRRLSADAARFLRFDPAPVSPTESECLCASRGFYSLFVYTTGTVRLQHGSLESIAAEKARLGNSLQTDLLFDPRPRRWQTHPGAIFRQLIGKARDNGMTIKNCFFCSYCSSHPTPASKKPIYCKRYHKRCTSNEAVTCSSYTDQTAAKSAHSRRESRPNATPPVTTRPERPHVNAVDLGNPQTMLSIERRQPPLPAAHQRQRRPLHVELLNRLIKIHGLQNDDPRAQATGGEWDDTDEVWRYYDVTRDVARAVCTRFAEAGGRIDAEIWKLADLYPPAPHSLTLIGTTLVLRTRFDDREQAKKLGGRWHPDTKSWRFQATPTIVDALLHSFKDMDVDDNVMTMASLFESQE